MLSLFNNFRSFFGSHDKYFSGDRGGKEECSTWWKLLFAVSMVIVVASHFVLVLKCWILSGLGLKEELCYSFKINRD